ncbi:methanol/ethanol family PQQ-dependent dehydrogenase [Xanthobacter oligotrophicus]|uniref:methanol/ethanol family PQQ-dependent dehydrogenase n=1 Tax=Xanthobacter oligotrophicus TaxID=2607286 RepID=UPI0011F15E1F|nr:methanol/ethanol family PQQ-dependent dehydrogenase [Xanthobacter oligotrophicus]MCG5234204.1 methanol/ethanol family PQQ-dependent dehydrogenase [Xanthobacter oligotrophicus]
MRAMVTATSLAASTAAALLGLVPAHANDDVLRRIADPAVQVLQTVDYANTRYSRLDQINAGNVGKLAVAWTFSTGVLRGHEGSPLVVDGVMYVHTPFPNLVYALDLDHDGRILWKYEPKQDRAVTAIMCCDLVNRGLAYAEGMVFLHQADTTIVALDARTGAVRWTVANGDPKKGESSTATVMPVKDKLIVGIAGAEFGARGHISAYNLKDGTLAWRAYSTGPDAEMLLDPKKTTELGKPVGADSSPKSWQGDQWKTGGGAPWGWFAYDPGLNLVYYGSANPSTWNPSQRPGDNKWSDTVFARDADTGVARWVYQMTPHDQWDFDGVNEMILTDQVVDGQKRALLTHFDRNGFAYTLDRATGALLLAEKFDPTVNWATGIDMDPASPAYGRPILDLTHGTEAKGEDETYTGICPAALGTKNQQPAAYSPATGLFYVPTNHLCMDYEPFHVDYTPGQPYVGATLTMYPAPGGDGRTGNFIAWDNGKGRIAWSVPERFSVWSGALATAGGVVFYGTLEGYLKAVDAATGKELYRFKTPSGIVGNVMTYIHRGRQYVAVLSGIGGWAGIGLAAGLADPDAGSGAKDAYAALDSYTALGGQLTVFALPDGF